jgi:hypothetical protein
MKDRWIEQSCQSGSDLDVLTIAAETAASFGIAARGAADPPWRDSIGKVESTAVVLSADDLYRLVAS